MPLTDLTMFAFAASNSLRVFAYVPQIIRVARDDNGCTAISYTTWGMFLVAHVSSVAYAVVNIQDQRMALIFSGNAVCCLIILSVAFIKQQRHLALRSTPVSTRLKPFSGQNQDHLNDKSRARQSLSAPRSTSCGIPIAAPAIATERRVL